MRNPAFVVLLGAALAGCASAKLKEKDLEIGRLQAVETGLRGEVKEYRGRVTALEGDKADAETRLADAEEKIKVYEGRVSYLEKSNKDLLEALEADHGELSRKLKELIKEKDAAGRRFVEAQRDKAAANRGRAAMKQALEAQQAELSDLKAKLEEAGRLAAEAAARAEGEREKRRGRVMAAREELGTLADSVLKEMQADRVKAVQDGETISLSFQDGLFFEPQKAVLTDAGAALIVRAAGAARDLAPRPVRVEVHTDNTTLKRGILGGFQDNWELSAARAAAAARALQAGGGVDPARLAACGFGEHRPVDRNETEAGRVANGRVVLTLDPASSHGEAP